MKVDVDDLWILCVLVKNLKVQGVGFEVIEICVFFVEVVVDLT